MKTDKDKDYASFSKGFFESKRFRDLLVETGWKDHEAEVRLLVMHQVIDGARVGPSDYTFRNHEDVVAMNDLPASFTAVLSGHIHRGQVLEERGRPPVLYPGSIERTSFAEKNEVKGFYDLKFSLDPSGKGRLSEMRFVPLPARPMKDIEVDPTADEESTRDRLREAVSKLDPDSIVRIRPRATDRGHALPDAPFFTNRFFQEIFPDTMNFQLSGSFFTRITRKGKG